MDGVVFGHDDGVAVLVQAAAVYELALGAAALGVFLVCGWIGIFNKAEKTVTQTMGPLCYLTFHLNPLKVTQSL